MILYCKICFSSFLFGQRRFPEWTYSNLMSIPGIIIGVSSWDGQWRKKFEKWSNEYVKIRTFCCQSFFVDLFVVGHFFVDLFLSAIFLLVFFCRSIFCRAFCFRPFFCRPFWSSFLTSPTWLFQLNSYFVLRKRSRGIINKTFFLRNLQMGLIS